MKKSSRILAIVFAALFVAMVFAGCGGSDNYEKKLIGSWYEADDDSPYFTLYSDGTCEIDYRSGSSSRWAVVNGNQLKFTTIYGEAIVYTIVSIKGGCLTLEGNDGDTLKLWNSPQE